MGKDKTPLKSILFFLWSSRSPLTTVYQFCPHTSSAYVTGLYPVYAEVNTLPWNVYLISANRSHLAGARMAQQAGKSAKQETIGMLTAGNSPKGNFRVKLQMFT